MVIEYTKIVLTDKVEYLLMYILSRENVQVATDIKPEL